VRTLLLIFVLSVSISGDGQVDSSSLPPGPIPKDILPPDPKDITFRDRTDSSKKIYPESVPEYKGYTFQPKRFCSMVVGETFLGLGSMIGLSSVWYDDFERVRFHTFNDTREWLQMDKAGHLTTAYCISKIGIGTLKWSGVSPDRAALFGGLLGFVYQTELELLDGYSSGWGFSWSDMTMNAAGSLFAGLQQWKWSRQKISLKFSYHSTSYPDLRPELLGKDPVERIFKDYNGQTYWLSVSIASFLSEDSKFPQWLNASFGYGASGLLGGHENPKVNAAGEILPDLERERQFFFSLDADLWKIKNLPKFLRIFANTFGFIKIPFPAVGFSKEGVVFKPLYF
jgi:uncharacterized protein YfiM (DUF2279 family)